MEQNKEAKILEFIDSLTTTGKKTLDEGQVKGLIELLKKEKDLMNYAYYALMTQLRKDHAEIRYSALLTIHEIFMRSNKFRTMLEKDLSEFFELVVETNLDRPLPKPWPRAKDLKIKALELIKLWASAHGRQHFRLQDGLEYLKYCKKVDFNDMEARSVAQREQIQRIEEKKEKILNEKVLKIRSEMKEMTTEISNTVVQMESCFELLIPSATNDLFSSEDFETEIEELTTSSPNDSTFGDTLRDHGIYDLKKSITIEVKDNSQAVVKTNEDNLPIIENLNDLYKEMINRFLPMVTTWLKTLTKGNNCIDDLKKAIDLKQMIESVFKKYKDLKLKSNVPSLDTDDDDEDDFVEVKDKEGYEAEVKNTKVNKPSSQPSCSKVQTVAEKAYMWNFKHPEDNAKDPTSALSTLSKRIGNTATDESLPWVSKFAKATVNDSCDDLNNGL
ncbi:hypothetical protein JTE90_020726 [Oedothorax gibbosus]|uniref:VHS domain-containing protein n=1 Tax=Oedothorax gibbosus TaxID=931172 RepID=A0AAV6V5S6_9ARAC|nr:hypothetical protein JTE90_020726 [Oedothorax gibbosus]